MGQFSASPINKAVPSFRKRLRDYVKASGQHFEHFPIIQKKTFALTVFALSI